MLVKAVFSPWHSVYCLCFCGWIIPCTCCLRLHGSTNSLLMLNLNSELLGQKLIFSIDFLHHIFAISMETNSVVSPFAMLIKSQMLLECRFPNLLATTDFIAKDHLVWIWFSHYRGEVVPESQLKGDASAFWACVSHCDRIHVQAIITQPHHLRIHYNRDIILSEHNYPKFK